VMEPENVTRPKNIIISDSVLMGIEKHAYSNLKAEVGGMLFGKIDDEGNTVVIGSIPALTAAAEQISLTFTHDVWADILSKGEAQFPGEAIVGWYHTHPSFGLFLSDYDQFIQRNFFGKTGQIALVIDPIAGEMGWFSRSEIDKINMIYKENTKIGPKSASPEEANGAKSPLNKILTHGAVAVVSAALAFGISFSTRGPDLEENQRNLVESYNTLANYLSQPNFIYTIREGDSYESLSAFFYGDTTGEEVLRTDNSNVELEPGVNIFVRGPVVFFVAPLNYFPTPVPSVSPSPSGSPAPSVSPSPSGSPAPSVSPSPSGSPAPSVSPSPSPSPSASGGMTPGDFALSVAPSASVDLFVATVVLNFR
jgi:proteasome lid subunit RPN8/RPN11